MRHQPTRDPKSRRPTRQASMLLSAACAAAIGAGAWAAPRQSDGMLADTQQAAAAQPPAMQARLQAAVDVYERGDLAAARAQFEELSRAGVPAADYNLAVMNLRGEVPMPDNAKAVQLMTRAATHGFVTAQVGLGRLYETGEAGVHDLAQSFRWYELAAQAGSSDAQVAAGTARYLGRGVAKDLAQAARWYREAAKSGDVGAQYLIASMYEDGDGVEKDLRLARYWYGVAAQNGDEAAPGKLKELDAKLAAPAS